MKHDRRVRVLVLTLSVMLTHVGATPPLNPLVSRVPQPGSAPDECYESLAPAPTPRVDVASLPEPEVVPASIAAPPSRTLRAELGAAHDALVRNDRPAFDEHLANAREILAANYPPGAERTAAEDAVRAFDDASRLWDAQFESPFFDESSDAYARASRYPGYADAVRRGMFTDDRERRYYPAAESRDFVTAVAGERLARLGITTPTRVARTERATPPVPEPSRSVARNEPSYSTPSSSTPSSSTRSSSTQSTSTPSYSTPSYSAPSTSSAQRRTPRASSSSRRRTTSASSSSRNKSSIARSGQSVASAGSASASPDPSTPRPAATAPAPAAPAAAAPTPSASASPVAVGVPPAAPDPAPSSTTGDVADLPADTAGSTTETAETTDTTDTTLTTDTARPVVTGTDPATDTSPATTTSERRSVVVPALLILIGLGVLIVLFRASK
ncbi:MAG TPA: hypothetical protein VF883_00765 [Thermoanaerobaculia bacterium]|jgi:hypothetical protein